MGGTLWVVATPIGNLGDISSRAAKVLSRVDVIACEDTRRTRGLLAHLGISGPALVSMFEANEERRVPELLEHLEGGRDVALVTDAGMPAVSDPGYLAVKAALDAGFGVDVVPGPSAAVAALAISGLPSERFVFEGFLPRRKGQLRARLGELARDPRTIVLYESPRRLPALLREAAEALGDRRAAVARELTKVHQEVVRDRLPELARRFEEAPRGEVVVVIEGNTLAPAADLRVLAGRVSELVSEGVSRRDAAARVASDAGVSRRDVYEASLHRDSR